MKSITAVLLSALLMVTSGNLLAAKKEGKAYGPGGVSEEKMSDTAAEHRKAYAGENEKKMKEEQEEKEKRDKKTKNGG
ncbi:hypothetical protein [Sedimenticola hydrogenitrophicus]|uniref:hypothetical protein n=1 Tax=Sedimenticola hydrogenitrophicus TaxID=2967975 RepID=UPI0023B11F27|nr:hypothetical protein [Sedimenticola hydrogenitrophicus]